MKRICTVVLVLISGIACAQNTLPVIPFGERKADLYYWDTNWIDRYEQLHPNETNYPSMRHMNYLDIFGDFFLARACVAETPILVRGVAGAVEVSPINDNYLMITLDTTLSGRLPEQFKISTQNF